MRYDYGNALLHAGENIAAADEFDKALRLDPHNAAAHNNLGLALTAWFAWRRRQAVVITAFITGTLLTCDAWFDITTASGSLDRITAIASAVLLELPLATLLFAVASHLLYLTVRRVQAAEGVAGPLPEGWVASVIV